MLQFSLGTFDDIMAMLDRVTTHSALVALNDAVEGGFMRDRQQLAMADEEWVAWTLAVARKVAQLDKP